MTEIPSLSEKDAAIIAASLASASCSLLEPSSDCLETARRHFQAHYEFLLARQWPEPAKLMSAGMNIK